MKKYLIILLIPVIFAGCSGSGEKIIKSTFINDTPKHVQLIKVAGQDTTVLSEIFYYSNGNKRLEGEYISDSLYNGTWIGWYSNGHKNYEAVFNNGIRESDWTVWSFDGNLEGKDNFMIEEYDDGFPEVIRFYSFEQNSDSAHITGEIHFYDNRCKRVEGKVKNNKKHGHWIVWRRDGTTWSEGDFQYDVNYGWHTVYHENGRKFYEGEYRMGDRIGNWKMWDDEGNIERETEYEWDNNWED